MRVVVLGIAVLSSVFAQAKPDVAEILRKVGENYSNVKQYRFVLKQTGEDPASIEIAVEKPDKFRFVTDGQVITGDDRYGSVTMVSNGSTVWNFSAGLKQYTKGSTSLPMADTEPPEVTPDIFVFQAETFYITRYARLATAVDHATLIRQEAMQTAAGRVDCYVIQLKAPLPGFRDDYTWWVDQKRFVVLRDDTQPASARWRPSSSVFSVTSINEPLPEGIFQFMPPAGARLVEKFE
jgi:outer membrane lipoprotein-sorting protein